ncbi:MAG TPA: hypothetical protein ENN52_01425 [Methanofollis liminatans]|uniref:Glycosyltransferase RgtA/B/C/D-like domain-containing protein n=1 Tax=Methanofollis liminatans TaxID=2201 RepID=A0A831LY99_9EURY|nr:hypothetical protein [Methanofollis liminatans]
MYVMENIGRVIYGLVGVFTLISCLIWLVIRKRAALPVHLEEHRRPLIVLFSLFSILLAASILVLHFRPELYERPLLYFIVTAAIAGIIALEALIAPERYTAPILIQTVLLGLSIAWSQLLIFPGLLGVDPWFHRYFTLDLIGSASIPAGFSYSSLPVFHLIVGTNAILTATDYKIATMLSVGLGQIICIPLFLFLLGKFLFSSSKVGLMAALLATLANHQIYMSYWSIPNGLAAIYILAILFLLFKTRMEQSKVPYLLSIVAMVPLILTHTIGALGLVILLLLGEGLYYLYNMIRPEDRGPVFLRIACAFTIGMFSWWMYASKTFGTLVKLLEWGFNRDIFVGEISVTTNVAIVPLSEQIFNNIGLFLFFALSFIGIFYILSRKSHHVWIFAFIALTPLFIGFVSLVSGHSVIEHRWWYLSQILLAIPLAVSVLLVAAGTEKKGTRTVGKTLMFTLICGLAFLMILSPPANVDNNLFSPNSATRAAFTDPELQSTMTIIGMAEGRIGTDFYWNSICSLLLDARTISIDSALQNSNFIGTGLHLILIRDYIVHEPFTLYKYPYRITYDPGLRLGQQGFDMVYDSCSVRLYHSETTGP